MDPLAHTLVGAALARAGLGRKVRYGTAALIAGANLPDIDAVSYFAGDDMGLYIRRGWTHGLPAVAVLPLLLGAILYFLGRARRSSDPPRFRLLLLLSYLAVATHPALDWLNSYGVRLLMPLDERWFYGDAVFIIDPWLWLVLGSAVFLSKTCSRTGNLLWVALAGLSTWFMLAVPTGLLAAKTLWVVALVVVITLKTRRFVPTEAAGRRLAAIALGVTTIYIGLMVASAQYGRRVVQEELRRAGIPVERLMVGPVAVNPFVRDVVVETPSAYRYGTLEIAPRFRLQLDPQAIEKPSPSPIIERALASPAARGFVRWVRFPFVEVENRPGRYIVHLTDARYARSRTGGFGGRTIEVEKTPVPSEGQ